MTLFAHEDGAGSSPVVFLHGFGSCHGLWKPIASAISADRRTIAYDLPGHGASLDWPDAGPARTAVRAVSADIEARGIERLHLVGHSMGGAIATLLAAAMAQRVASLTLLAPGGYGPDINGRLLRRYAAAAGADEIRTCLAAMSGPRSPVPKDAVTALTQMRRRAGQTGKLLEIAETISRNDRQGVIQRDVLSALDMPVSVIWGTADSLLPYRHAQGLPPRFMLHTAQGIGHMLPEEVPDMVIDVIRRTIR